MKPGLADPYGMSFFCSISELIECPSRTSTVPEIAS